MAFLKKNWLMITLAAVCAASIGTAAWAYVSGGEINDQMQAVDALQRSVQGLAGGAQNKATIEARRKQIEAENAQLGESLGIALGVQKNSRLDGGPRKLLVPDILPEPQSPADRIDFKTKYAEAFARMLARLQGRDKATRKEVRSQQVVIDSRNQPVSQDDVEDAWRPPQQAATADEPDNDTKTGLQGILSEFPAARAAELVARSILMYVSKNAIPPHDMVDTSSSPEVLEIWHAQMSLWIEQDIVAALAGVNEKRSAQLDAEGNPYDAWVANMPIKHLKKLAMAGHFGNGGAVNKADFAGSFTKQKNSEKRFIIPIHLQLVVEEAAVMEVLESLCGVGFYTPLRVEYHRVEPTPLQNEYIYGDEPVVEVWIDLEAYYFRKVFDDWIPKKLKSTLEKDGAKERQGGRR